MSIAMNLLLLLSALLSALTGVGAGVRAPQVARAVAGAAGKVTVAAPRVLRASVRPAQGLPAIRAVADFAGVANCLAAAEPIWASRRRE